jgi:hypothetical protein
MSFDSKDNREPALIDRRVALVAAILHDRMMGEDAELQPRKMFELHKVAAEIVEALDAVPVESLGG